jgi:hypothetical protein
MGRRIASSSVADRAQAADGVTRKSLLGTGLAAAAGYAAAPAALGAPNRDTATAKRLTKLRKAREKVVIEHARAENLSQLDETLATFTHAHQEVIPTGAVFDGVDAVKGYYERYFTEFADQHNSDVTMRHADCAVVAEVMLSGTMTGPLGPIPATNKSFRLRAAAFFLFAPNTAKLVGERVYWDLFTLLQQIGVLQAVVDAGLVFPAGGGIPINKREPGVKALKN